MKTTVLPPPPVHAAQHESELRDLLALYVDVAPRSVVEIGTWRGGTLYYWLTYARAGATVVSIDLGPDEWRPPEPDFDNSQWLDWCPVGVGFYALIGNSQDVEIQHRTLDILEGGIDWLFIDGDHTYEGVKADWQMWRPYVRAGGVVAFHDLKTPDNPNQQHIQVGRLWEEIKRDGFMTSEFTVSGLNWGGIGVVYL